MHRVNNVLSEAGSKANEVIESFLSALNSNISRGIPVGPAPSILISEAIMADIDKKILSYTDSFVRYVDDIYIIFEDYAEAWIALHELSRYLYTAHRLVFSSEKTMIVSVNNFESNYLKEDEKIEAESIREKLAETEKGGYSEPEKITPFEKLEAEKKLKIRAEVYQDLFKMLLTLDKIELGLMRHVLRQAGIYKIRNIIPLIFKHFNKLLPVLREIVVYFDRVLNVKTVVNYKNKFEELLNNEYLELPYVNIWIFTLFQNDFFNAVQIKIDYTKIQRIREKALIARRENNTVWIKEIKNGVDTLGPWDKRAVLYSSIIISKDELVHWLGLESSKGDILNSAICSMIIADKKAAS